MTERTKHTWPPMC